MREEYRRGGTRGAREGGVRCGGRTAGDDEWQRVGQGGVGVDRGERVGEVDSDGGWDKCQGRFFPMMACEDGS